MAGDERFFSLTDNPFALTGLTPRASRDQIEAARERGAPAWAVETLLDPYRRLPEELAWLPGSSGQAAQEAVAALAQRDAAATSQAIVLARGLAKANLAADAALRFGDVELVEPLMRAWEAVNPPDVVGQVNADRMISGFPATNPAQVDWALQTVRARHAASAARLLAAAGDEGRDRLVRIIERPNPSGQETDRRLIEALVIAYEEEQAEVLDQREEAILAEVGAMTREGRDGTDRLEGLMQAWALLHRPSLLFARMRGRDDGRALELVGAMRTRYLDPTAGPGRVGAAGRIAQLVLSQFPDSPAIQRMVGGDAQRLGAGLAAPLPSTARADEDGPSAQRAIQAERARRAASRKESQDAARASRSRGRQTAASVPANAREQLLAAVRARYQQQQQQQGRTPQLAKKGGCGCGTWLIPVAIAIFFIVKALLKADGDRPATASAPPPVPTVEAPAPQAMPPLEPVQPEDDYRDEQNRQTAPTHGDGPPTVSGEEGGGGG